MTSSILLFKIGGSIGAASVVAGGSYVAYQNSDSIKKFFGSGKQDSSTSTDRTEPKVLPPIKSNLFLVRYKEGKPSGDVAIETDASLTCDYADTTGTVCKIYKFAIAKKDNNLTSNEIKTLDIPANTSEFTNDTYFAIELTDVTKSAADLHNKTFTIKKGDTVQGKFEFDQIIIGEAKKDDGAADTPKIDTYIVKKTTAWTAITDPFTSYRCKFAGNTANSTIDNYDSTCKLTKITTTGTDNTITTFAEVKSLNADITAEALKADTDNYYKLTVNSKLLYNLSFTGNDVAPIQIELIKEDATTLGSLDIKQKLVDGKFIGKTDLLLAKVTKNDENFTGALTNAKCNLTKAVNGSDIVAANQFGCSLYKSTLAASKPIHQLTLGTTELASPTNPIPLYDYYLIKLTEEKNIADFESQTTIFYQIADNSSSPKTHKQIELTIFGLMSGEFTTGKKPFFITEPTITQEQ